MNLFEELSLLRFKTLVLFLIFWCKFTSDGFVWSRLTHSRFLRACIGRQHLGSHTEIKLVLMVPFKGQVESSMEWLLLVFMFSWKINILRLPDKMEVNSSLGHQRQKVWIITANLRGNFVAICQSNSRGKTARCRRRLGWSSELCGSAQVLLPGRF